MAKVKKVEDNELQLICDCGAVHVLSMEEGKFKIETYSAKPKGQEHGKEADKTGDKGRKRTIGEFFGFGEPAKPEDEGD